ncbi:MAG: metal-dependent transcriptional regulator [Oligoflexia bacterium]|nr:metal-dependent transcriptional regulator [Oligoflexia bacterium]
MEDIKEKLSPTMEDYLEIISSICKENKVARIGEIAKKMEVRNPSVNAAMKFLCEKELVHHEKYGFVSLTNKGQKIASEIQDKHDVLYKFLTEILWIDKRIADKDACEMEHAISKHTFTRLIKFFKFLEEGLVCCRPKLLQNFETYLKTGERVKCNCKKQE